MGNRVIPTETKVKALSNCLKLEGVNAAAAAHGVSAGAIEYWFQHKLLPALPALLANEKPGPAPQPARSSTVQGLRPRTASRPADGRPKSCPQCGSARVWKNGLYTVLNWLAFLCVGWFTGVKVRLQRFRCAECGYELASAERQRQAAARRRGWLKLQQLVAFSKFKLGLSHRRTQLLAQFVYGKQVSLAFVNAVTQTVGQRATGVLARLSSCRQNVARVLMGDETFPKILDRQALRASAKSVGVVICEFGLIRGVKSIRNQSWQMAQLFRSSVGAYFRPEFFLSDYEVHYPAIVRQVLSELRQLKDFVHTVRVILRAFEQAVRDVTLSVPRGLPRQAQQTQKRLKRRLLRQRLQPILRLFLQAFGTGYESVACLYIEEGLRRLSDPSCVVQNESVQALYKQLRKFFAKHGQTLAFQFEQKAQQALVSTSNSLESKQSIFKVFTRMAKSFQRAETCENLLNGVALMENFDVKTRGVHAGTSAMQRAGINLADLGATNFFAAVGLA